MKKIIILIFIVLTYTVNAQDDNISKAKKLGDEGIEKINSGEFNKAIELFTQAMALDPATLDYPYEKALAYYQKKDYLPAIAILDSLRKEPNAPEQVFQLLGDAYDLLKKKQKAVEVYEEGLRRFPNSGRLYLERGIVEVGNKKPPEYIGYWEKGIEVDPAYPNNYYFLADHYYKTWNKIWAALYGEIFMNISSNQARVNEMSKTLFKTYKEALSVNSNGKKIVRFTTTYYKPHSPKIPFAGAYEETMKEASESIMGSASDSDSISIETISKIRKYFINLWFQKKYNEKFPNILFDFQKKLIDNNVYDVYSYWLLNQGNPEEFKEWLKENNDKLKNFGIFISGNPLVIDKEHNFNMSQYDEK